MDSRILLLTLGFRCNNNCIFCSVASQKHNKDASPGRIISAIDSGLRQGYDKVEFIGGEPTMYPELLDYIGMAREKGYKRIALTTNARLLYYENNARKLASAGINEIAVTLYSHDRKIHEATTRTPGSFAQSVEGLKNALRHFPRVHVNTVVYNANCTSLSETSAFLHGLGVMEWHLLDLIPEGDALKRFSMLAPRLAAVSAEVDRLAVDTRKSPGLSLAFYDFSECVLDRKHMAGRNISMCGVGVRHATEQVTYGKSDITQEVEGEILDTRKTVTDTCRECMAREKCGGLWTKYLELYGDSEIIELSEKHGYK